MKYLSTIAIPICVLMDGCVTSFILVHRLSVTLLPFSLFRTKKVFLGGLSLSTEEGDIRAVLEPLGELESVQIMTEKETGKPRGFGFATFADFDVVDKICIKKFIKIKVGPHSTRDAQGIYIHMYIHAVSVCRLT